MAKTTSSSSSNLFVLTHRLHFSWSSISILISTLFCSGEYIRKVNFPTQVVQNSHLAASEMYSVVFFLQCKWKEKANLHWINATRIFLLLSVPVYQPLKQWIIHTGRITDIKLIEMKTPSLSHTYTTGILNPSLPNDKFTDKMTPTQTQSERSSGTIYSRQTRTQTHKLFSPHPKAVAMNTEMKQTHRVSTYQGVCSCLHPELRGRCPCTCEEEEPVRS